MSARRCIDKWSSMQTNFISNVVPYFNLSITYLKDTIAIPSRIKEQTGNCIYYVPSITTMSTPIQNNANGISVGAVVAQYKK